MYNKASCLESRNWYSYSSFYIFGFTGHILQLSPLYKSHARETYDVTTFTHCTWTWIKPVVLLWSVDISHDKECRLEYLFANAAPIDRGFLKVLTSFSSRPLHVEALHVSWSSNIVLFWENAWSPPACAVLLVSPLHKLPPPQPLLAAKEFVWSRSGGGAANRMGCAIHVHLRHSSRQSGRFLLALTYIRAVSLCSVHHVMPWHAEMNGQSTGVAVTRCSVDS